MKRKSYLLLCLITGFIQADEPKKMICHDKKECYPEIFEATHIFQVVRQDQILPPGLHIRINFNTGVKEAKIMDENEKEENNIILVYQNAHTQTTIINQKKPISDKYEIKPNLKIPQEDREKFSIALTFLTSNNYNNSKDLIDILSLLEELSHELEFGIEICKSRIVVEHLIHLLKSSESVHVKKLAITVLGASLQNNPQALLYISDLKLTEVLLKSLDSEYDTGVMMKLLYALSSIVKSQNGMNDFFIAQGDKILYRIFKKTQNPALISKCASFIADNYFQVENYDHDKFNVTLLSFSIFIDSIVKHWCKDLQVKFFKNYLNIDSKEKILSALSSLKKQYSSLCRPINGFLERLDYETTLIHDKDHPYIIFLKSTLQLFKN
ncbi:hypothetical protein PORY_000385 [Pneumocystis oryctolagi]|uniref:Uncharacterized protein n=1 Tax=Pneumocystis oryctolagi TaxID=42067 RepID=A0ACB7CGP3_9ASCO|nr:hypothetical protein PORY_000385 [Pneumocystis oryctolagi]